MKRIIGLILALCVLCACGAALAEEWTCFSCGKAGNDGNFCPNCGAERAETAWSDEEAASIEAEWKGAMLKNFYLNAAARGFDTPCLTNLVRVKDGREEASCLAVAVYDPYTDLLGIFAGGDIVSEGCDYYWQCGVRERYEVQLASTEVCAGLVIFLLDDPNDEDKISIDVPYAGYTHAGENLTIRYYVIDEAGKMMLTKSRAAQALGYRDEGDYQAVDVSPDGGAIGYLNEQPLWSDGIRCVFLNEKGEVCGIHVAEYGYVSPLVPEEGTGGEPAENAVENTPGNAPEIVSTAAALPAQENDAVVQDLYSYMQNRMTFERAGTSKNGQQYRSFRGGEDSYELITSYVKALCAEGNFELLDSHYDQFDTRNTVIFSYALKYTGSAKVSGDKPKMNFEDGVYGDVTVYGLTERSRCNGYIYIVDGLEFGDLGLRAGGGRVSTAPAGQSLAADLLRHGDGSYETSDGRFHVKVGEAMVYRDGSVCTTDATLLRNRGQSREELRIYDFYRNESILLTVPYNSVDTGDFFDQRTIGYNGNLSTALKSMEAFLGWKFSDQILGVCHNGDYLLCFRDDQNDLKDVSVRVMYWDTERREAVFYVYASFDTAPYEYEAVAAVRMEDAAEQPSQATGGGSELFDDCPSCGGDGRCDTCGGSGKVTKWVGDQYMTVDCTAYNCMNGKCTTCGGRGHK